MALTLVRAAASAATRPDLLLEGFHRGAAEQRNSCLANGLLALAFIIEEGSGCILVSRPPLTSARRTLELVSYVSRVSQVSRAANNRR